mgnify:CR=1 FL=1
MVWQDFMFACGNYPTFPALLESIRKEAVANVRRLRHHPSIVLYVGNNEDYQVRESSGLTYNYEDKNREDWLRTNFPARYIYEEILPSVIEEESPGVFYHPGSPWGDGRPTTDPTVGDIHLWNGMSLPCLDMSAMLTSTSLARTAGEVPDLRLAGRPVQQRVRHGGVPAHPDHRLLCRERGGPVSAVARARLPQQGRRPRAEAGDVSGRERADRHGP